MIEETFPESITIFMSNTTPAKASLIYKLKAGRQIALFSKRNAVL